MIERRLSDPRARTACHAAIETSLFLIGSDWLQHLTNVIIWSNSLQWYSSTSASTEQRLFSVFVSDEWHDDTDFLLVYINFVFWLWILMDMRILFDAAVDVNFPDKHPSYLTATQKSSSYRCPQTSVGMCTSVENAPDVLSLTRWTSLESFHRFSPPLGRIKRQFRIDRNEISGCQICLLSPTRISVDKRATRKANEHSARYSIQSSDYILLWQ